MIRLGIIGCSDGNGHPYSWSAICNGFSKSPMNLCEYPVIPEYLSSQIYPDDFISNARVTHIWTQDINRSRLIAKASKIINIVENFEDMIGEIDGLLLARDDSENHKIYAEAFIEAGIPIYIDKPMATTIYQAQELFSLEKYSGQIFSCSALRYADELLLSKNDRETLGKILHISGVVPNSWKKYSMHVIEPILKGIKNPGEITKWDCTNFKDKTFLNLCWDSGLTCQLAALGNVKSDIAIDYFGTLGRQRHIFKDPFSAFKKALLVFINDSIIKKRTHKNKILSSISILEKGLTQEDGRE